MAKVQRILGCGETILEILSAQCRPLFLPVSCFSSCWRMNVILVEFNIASSVKIFNLCRFMSAERFFTSLPHFIWQKWNKIWWRHDPIFDIYVDIYIWIHMKPVDAVVCGRRRLRIRSTMVLSIGYHPTNLNVNYTSYSDVGYEIDWNLPGP